MFGATLISHSLPELLARSPRVEGRATVRGKECLQLLCFKEIRLPENAHVPYARIWVDDRDTHLIWAADMFRELLPDDTGHVELVHESRPYEVDFRYEMLATTQLGGISYPEKFVVRAVSPKAAKGHEAITEILPGTQLGGQQDAGFEIPSELGVIEYNPATGRAIKPTRAAEETATEIEGMLVKNVLSMCEALAGSPVLTSLSDKGPETYLDLPCADLSIIMYGLVLGKEVHIEDLEAGPGPGTSHDREITQIIDSLRSLSLPDSVSYATWTDLSHLSEPAICLLEDSSQGSSHYAVVVPKSDGSLLMASPDHGHLVQLTAHNDLGPYGDRVVLIGPQIVNHSRMLILILTVVAFVLFVIGASIRFRRAKSLQVACS